MSRVESMNQYRHSYDYKYTHSEMSIKALIHKSNVSRGQSSIMFKKCYIIHTIYLYVIFLMSIFKLQITLFYPVTYNAMS